MSTDIDFKALWNNGARADAPNATEIFKKGHQLQRRARNKIVLCNLLLACTFIFITWVWIYYQPEMITTKIGLVLVMIALVFYLVKSMGYISLLNKDNIDASTSEYLQHLLKIKYKQDKLNTHITSVYFVLLSVGLALYMIEYIRMMSVLYGIIYCGITTVWMVFNVFYTHPRIIKKQRERLDVVINKLIEVNGQLDKD